MPEQVIIYYKSKRIALIKNDHHLQKCRELIEQSLNWGDSNSWTNEDFENISDRIFEKTQTRLSVSTLKRIWGKVRYESSPNIATLNALAKFLGFSNWREFQQQYPPDEPVKQEPGSILQQKAPVDTPKSGSGKKLLMPAILAVLIAVISLGLISLLGKKEVNKKLREAAPVQFESRIVSDGLPNSVVFDYDVSSFHSDSVYIQQSWDPMRREKVPVSGRHHTSIYYYPGFFKAKLIVDGQVKKEHDVFIKTKGWVGLVSEMPAPIYLTEEEIKWKGSLGISSKTLIQKTNSPIFNNKWVGFFNIREFEGSDAADFTFATTLRNSSSLQQSACRKAVVNITGTTSAIIIPLAARGCISDINLLTGDRWIMGKENDLSAFGCDFSNYQHLSCTVAGHHLKIYLNGHLIMDTEQKQSIGNIIGLQIAFEGAGEVKDIKLGSRGKTVYQEQF